MRSIVAGEAGVPSKGWRFEADDAFDALALRSAFMNYVRRHAHEDSDFDGAELVFGELVANVVSHAPGHISIFVEWCGDALTLNVVDRGGGFVYVPSNMASRLNEERGRGLAIVAQLTDGLSFSSGGATGSHTRAVLKVYRDDGGSYEIRTPPWTQRHRRHR